MNDDSTIRTVALSRSFGPRLAVDGLHLAVPPGSVYGFLGPNGAGKTTTIRLLLGLLRPTAGTVFLFGRELFQDRFSLLRRCGALVESPSHYPHLTGEENLRHACLLKGVPAAAINRVLEIVSLRKDAGRLVRTYSLGMKQRLGLAQALLGSPELIILDEPTNGLDPAGIQEMRQLLRDMPASHGVTVFLSSHLLSEVEQIATHVGIIAAGKLQFQGSLQQIRDQQKSTLRIGIDRPLDASQALQARGWQAAAVPPSTVLVPSGGPEADSRINRFLIEHGFSVHSLSREQPSLEDAFLQITQEARS